MQELWSVPKLREKYQFRMEKFSASFLALGKEIEGQILNEFPLLGSFLFLQKGDLGARG